MKHGLTRIIVCACFILNSSFPIIHSAHAQVAGLNTLTVFDLSSTGRSAGLGMDYLSLFDASDLTVGIDNPSLICDGMSGAGVLSFVPLFSGGSMGTLAYAHNFGRIGTVVFGFRYVNYGRFEEYDEEENHLDSFGAGDYSVSVGWNMWIDSNFSIGATFKPVLSQYEQYTAFAVLFDVAGSFVSDDRRLAATLMGRNIGAQIVTFDESVEYLPFELSAEFSYKLKNAPFRLFFAATELQQWDLRYEDPLNPTSTTDPFSGEVIEESKLAGVFDNLMRHTLMGVELSLGKSLFARVGYSWRQNAEMQGFDVFNLSGFSFGVGLRVKKFEFSYARHNYHLSQAPNYLTLSYRF